MVISDRLIVHAPVQRVANITRTPVAFQETVQVLRYKPGQYYGAHLDYTNRLNYGARYHA